MSYQVLARKWRPKSFQEMVGQEHVLKALIHALEHKRLHHAYLFTGTRGVGKTTIGRILAKCLNCETGIVATPCGECSVCREVNEGRFVDLIEIDAASRTKVEDMRELLDNVQYSPTRGRFKVYLIDEVHMLSTSSFNALLKTLEEPPEHVKFLLATTDPQKLPVTILSRCLQFNLKNMAPERIVSHLAYVLGQEHIPFEENALWLLARSADGSMRDALSLTDQSIAYGDGQIQEDQVSEMLGTVGHKQILALVEAIGSIDAVVVLQTINKIAEFSPDYENVLAQLISVFHRLAIEQAVPGATDNTLGDQREIVDLAQRFTAEDVQLFYQFALIGRKDLAITPDRKAGFEMALLRMIAFRPNVKSAEDLKPMQAIAPAKTVAEPVVPTKQASTTAAPTMIPAAMPTPAVMPTGTPTPAATTTRTAAPPVQAPREGSPSAPPVQAPTAPPWDTAASSKQAVDEPVSSPSKAKPVTPELSGPPPGHPAFESDYPDYANIPDDDDDSDEPRAAYNGKTSSNAQKKTAETLGKASVVPQVSVAEPAEASSSAQAVAPARPEQRQTPIEKPVFEHEEIKPPASIIVGSVPIDGDRDGDRDGDSAQSALVDTRSVGSLDNDFDWLAEIDALGLSGMTLNIASNCSFELNGQQALLSVDEGNFRLLTDQHRQRIIDALRLRLGADVQVGFVSQVPLTQTPSQKKAIDKEERLQLAVETIQNDTNVMKMMQMFDASIIVKTIEPIG